MSWRDKAACRGVDSEIFFPLAGSHTLAGRQQVAAAKTICARCPVRQQCLAWAVDALPYGVAGGLSEDERAVLRGSSPRAASRHSDDDRCGTEAGAKRHRRGGEEVCGKCRVGSSRAWSERNWRRALAVKS